MLPLPGQLRHLALCKTDSKDLFVIMVSDKHLMWMGRSVWRMLLLPGPAAWYMLLLSLLWRPGGLAHLPTISVVKLGMPPEQTDRGLGEEYGKLVQQHVSV